MIEPLFAPCSRDDCNYATLELGETCACGKYEALEIKLIKLNEAPEACPVCGRSLRAFNHRNCGSSDGPY